MTLSKFKFAVLNLDEFSDMEIEKLFLDIEISNEEDIQEILGIIKIHRLELHSYLESKYKQ